MFIKCKGCKSKSVSIEINKPIVNNFENDDQFFALNKCESISHNSIQKKAIFKADKQKKIWYIFFL